VAPKQKHRQPIIDACVTLFRRHGYAATGLNDIVDASGAPKVLSTTTSPRENPR